MADTGRRARFALQPIREGLLQICCRCSQPKQSIQFVIVGSRSRPSLFENLVEQLDHVFPFLEKAMEDEAQARFCAMTRFSLYFTVLHRRAGLAAAIAPRTDNGSPLEVGRTPNRATRVLAD